MTFTRVVLKSVFLLNLGLLPIQAQGANRTVTLQPLEDGKRASCDGTVNDTTNTQGNKHMSLALVSSISEEPLHRAHLSLRLIRCENGSFQKDTHPDQEHYTTFRGEDVFVYYSDYRMTVVNNDDQLLHIIPLPELSKTGETEFEMALIDNKTDLHLARLFLTVHKKVIYKGQIVIDERMPFGAFDLTFEE